MITVLIIIGIMAATEAIRGIIKIYKEVDQNGDWCPECNFRLKKVGKEGFEKVVHLYETPETWKCTNCHTEYVAEIEEGERKEEFKKVA